jgi:hypothetical protein
MERAGGWRMKPLILISMALLALSACSTQQQPTQTACVVAPVSGFVGADRAQERITVAQNGSPCMISASIDDRTMGAGTVATPPAHGTATVRRAAEATQITYTPQGSYLGTDSFEVALGPNFTISVQVQVVPIAAKP